MGTFLVRDSVANLYVFKRRRKRDCVFPFFLLFSGVITHHLFTRPSQDGAELLSHPVVFGLEQDLVPPRPAVFLKGETEPRPVPSRPVKKDSLCPGPPRLPVITSSFFSLLCSLKIGKCKSKLQNGNKNYLVVRNV